MAYRAPLGEIEFVATRVVDQDRLAATARFADAGAETRGAILAEAAKLAEGVLAPVNRASDLTPAWVENGVVRTAPGVAAAYRAIADGGWVGINADAEYGGMGLPLSLTTMVGEMFAAACLSLSLSPLMTQGEIEALEHHGSDALKALYLPKLVSGEWTGTMNLTEPQAGSDVGALTTRAEANGDGSYAVTGQKIYITWGDHDMAANVCHLVLARLPGAQAGTKGISLFLVPKFIPDADGAPGRANAVAVLGLEHKLGLHGSPTATMQYDGATGWLVGPEQGGMAAMFTMMNNARLGVAVQGLGVAEAACQLARAHAAERRQGATPDGSPGIVGHADVRRMLMAMTAQTQVARALCYDCALAIDLGKALEDAGARDAEARRAAFLTPIAKAFATDTGCEVAHMGVQVHGGAGVIEATGAAQLARDVRVTAIYEGTNGIQAMDLVGRKLALDQGATARLVIAEIAGTAVRLAQAGGAYALAAEAAMTAAQDAKRATDWMLGAQATDRAAGAVAYLRLMALALGAHYLGRAALAEQAPEAAADRLALARFYAHQMAPQTTALARAATQGAAVLYAIPAARLTA